MRLYGGKYVRNDLNRKVDMRTETKDAILWDVDSINRHCRVKIQGSNQLITVYYPLNWEKTPVYMKPGNAVKIMHTGGNRARLEIVGHGGLRPTAMPGATGSPIGGALADTVLSGLVLSPTDPISMTIAYSTGTFRLDGVIYTAGLATLGSGAVLGSGLTLGVTLGGSVTLDAASSTYFRYDAIVIGKDSIVEVVKGSNYTVPTEASYPTIPSEHMLLAYVLVPPNASGIYAIWIQAAWSAPRPTTLSVTCATTDMYWPHLTPFPSHSTTITVRMLDQYQNLLTGTYTLNASFIMGNGILSHGTASSESSLTWISNGNDSIVYTRMESKHTGGYGSDLEHTPTVLVTCTSISYISPSFIQINLYDALGLLISMM